MFEDVKHQVAVATRILAEAGFSSGVLASLGHISMRAPEDPSRFVVKGRGYRLDALATMRPEDMVVCDLDGYLVEAPPSVMQCFEVKMHSCIYKTHPEVQSVVHVHPRFTVLMSVLQARLLPMCNEGADLVRRPLPVYRHNVIVQTDAEGMEVATLLGDSRAILLLGHGATTVGASLEEFFMRMLHLEEQARMNWYAACAGGPDHPGIPEDLLAERPADRAELPHFQASQSIIGGGPRVGGVWAYLTDLIETRMKQEGLTGRG
jgi:ribulose-5-phosphate 4-epimerase/fuculose-1-phosphate aldolase